MGAWDNWQKSILISEGFLFSIYIFYAGWFSRQKIWTATSLIQPLAHYSDDPRVPRNVEQVMTVAYEKDNSRFHTFWAFPLIVSDAISCPLHNLKTLWYYHDTSKLWRTGLNDVSCTRMTTLAFILSELFPVEGFRCNFWSAP